MKPEYKEKKTSTCHRSQILSTTLHYTYIVTALYVDETRVQREKNIDLPQVTNTFNNITVIW